MQCEDDTAIRGVAHHDILYALLLGEAESVAVDGEELKFGLAPKHCE